MALHPNLDLIRLLN